MYQEHLKRFNWLMRIAFVAVHLAVVAVIWVGFSWIGLIAMVITYSVRMFGIVGGYHRYFAHRAFKTGRVFQFILAILGAAACQKGPLWWAAIHRHHHKYSDTPEDAHSPKQGGFWWSHMGWIFSGKFRATKFDLVPDMAKFPELVWLNRFHVIVPISLGVFMFALGYVLQHFTSIETTGPQMLVWGFIISTVFLWHGTFFVNSLTHVFGKKRFETEDDSRNSFIISFITLGEGWHNNHHKFQTSSRSGFYWWELDITYYTIKILSWLRIASELKYPPEKVYANQRSFFKTPGKLVPSKN